MALIQRNTAYSVNDIVNTKYGIKLKCTTAGTTSTDPLILDGTSPITDGTVVWEVQEEQGSEKYSTTEQEIGTWIDGKKLYQKTYVLTTPETAGVSVSVADLPTGVNSTDVIDYNYVVYLNGFVYTKGYRIIDDNIVSWIRSNGTIAFRVESAIFTNADLIYTLKYTKQ